MCQPVSHAQLVASIDLAQLQRKQTQVEMNRDSLTFVPHLEPSPSRDFQQSNETMFNVRELLFSPSHTNAPIEGRIARDTQPECMLGAL